MTDPKCPHSEIAFQPKNISFKNTTLHYLELYGACATCNARIVFKGAATGKVLDGPSMTEDGLLIRLPFYCEEK